MGWIHGVGWYEKGEFTACVGKKHNKEYKLWSGMLERCYSEVFKELEPTYKKCEASNNFKNYQFFAKWCQSQIGFKNKGWHLDKDILIKGNKLYSEDTCVFVPREINNFLTLRVNHRGQCPIGVKWHKGVGKYYAAVSIEGVTKHLGYFENVDAAFKCYSSEKERLAKCLAEKWRGIVDDRVVEALIAYKVELGD